MKRTLSAIMLSIAAFSALPAAADPAPTVANIKVVSDKVPDVSSLEAWKKSYITENMSDKEKAMAVWKTIAGHQHQDVPPPPSSSTTKAPSRTPSR